MDKEEIIQYCLKNYPEQSITQIANLFSINRKILSKMLKNNGIEVISKRRIYQLEENFFENINTEEKAYWLGFIAADGCVYRRTLKISLNERDREHLEKFKKSLKSNSIIQEIPGAGFGEGTILSKIEINSAKMISDLLKHGIVPKKSLVLKPPNIPEFLERHWIKGYLDGDGTFIPQLKNGNAQLSFLGTEEVLRWIEYKLTGQNTHSLYSKNKDLSKNSYQLCFGGTKSIEKYINFLYNDATFYLDRKYQKVLEFKSRFKK